MGQEYHVVRHGLPRCECLVPWLSGYVGLGVVASVEIVVLNTLWDVGLRANVLGGKEFCSMKCYKDFEVGIVILRNFEFCPTGPVPTEFYTMKIFGDKF